MSADLRPIPPSAVAASTWPAVDLRQIRRMTDDTGLIQHAVYATPDPHHGYCIDDNARALLLAVRLARLDRLGTPGDEALPIHTYLQFVFYAYNPAATPGRFRNFMGFDRSWLEAVGSEDSQARALWALGEATAYGPTPNVRDLSREMYERSLTGVATLGHARSWAFALLGVLPFLQARPDHGPSQDVLPDFAHRLADHLHRHTQADWPWWEPIVTYDNAKLPHALLLAGRALRDPGMCDEALRCLAWLLEQQLVSDASTGRTRLSIIGNDGWLPRGGPKAAFDQQPLEAWALVEACLDAARCVDDGPARRTWEAHARTCFNWFTGGNDLGLSLIDPDTGGCRDGLQPTGVNRNHGAESTLSYALAVVELDRYEREHPGALARFVSPPEAV